jgi:hypothetical protein
MTIQVNSNVDELIKNYTLKIDKIQPAVKVAIDRTGRKTTTKARRYVSDEIGVTKTRANKRVFPIPSTFDNLTFDIRGLKKPFSLASLKSKPKKTSRGVSYRLKSKMVKVFGGFGAKVNSGKQYFKREGKKRLPIEGLKTLSARDVLQGDKWQGIAKRFVEDEIKVQIEKQFEAKKITTLDRTLGALSGRSLL